MLKIKITRARSDAAQRLTFGEHFRWDGHRHVISLQSSSPDEKGISSFSYFQKALVILRGGKLGRVLIDGGNLAICANGKVNEDSRTRHTSWQERMVEQF